MGVTRQQQFFIDLFTFTRDGRPYPGHGVRVDPPGPNDQAILRHGTIEDRAQMGKRALEHDLMCLEQVGDDRVPMLHCWTGTEVFAAAFGCPVQLPEHSMPFALPAVHTANDADRLIEPADSPKTVTFEASPPNTAAFARTQRRAAIWSWSPLFPLVAYPGPRPLRSSQPNGPIRYCSVTSTTPRPAKAAPSYQGSRVEPAVKPPPWMKTITGAAPLVDGVQTLR